MKYIKPIIITLLTIFVFGYPAYAKADSKDGAASTKKERNLITKGNALYNEGRYQEAMKQYKLALDVNPSSVVGKYNMGLSELRIGSNAGDTTETAKKMLESGVKYMQQVANMGSSRPDLASRANYNLGNVAFNSQDYGSAINYYKQALRLNQNDNNARRNLRIAQLKQQQQDKQDQNQDQEENKEEDKNEDQNKDQEQDQNQQQNQDQNQEQNPEQNQDQNQNSSPSIDQQTAEQIMNAIENKENQTRARVAGQNAEKSRQRNRNRYNW